MLRTIIDGMEPGRALRLAALVLLLSGALLMTALSSYTWYVNNVLSDPLNPEAEYPRESFEMLWEEMEVDRPEKAEFRNLKELEEPRLRKRLRVAGTGLLDSAVAGDYIFGSYSERNGSASVVSGQKINLCGGNEGSPDIYCDHDSKYVNIYSAMYKSWIEFGLELRSLERFYTNETAVKQFNGYVERAEFYDSYLDPEGFEIRPVEAVYYSSESGLYLVGDSNSSLRLNGEEAKLEQKGYLSHSSVSIPPGENTVSRGNYTVELKVHRRIPGAVYREDRGLVIASLQGQHRNFPRARIVGDGLDRTVEVTNGSREYSVETEPEKVIFMGEGQNVSYFLPRAPESRWDHGKAMGMTEREYRQYFIPELLSNSPEQ